MSFIYDEIALKEITRIDNHLREIGIDSLRSEIIEGLSAKDKYISSKFFYDDVGSKLFEDITHLQEYYPTRTERSILDRIAPDLMRDFKKFDIIELGSGDASKISILLDGIPKANLDTITYFPLDVSKDAIEKSAGELSQRFNALKVHGIIADFITQLDIIPSVKPRLFCFFGSTIGNFEKEMAHKFLKNVSQNMNRGDRLLLGMDMVKSDQTLFDAYNDTQGVTAQFNKNILNVTNGLLGSKFNTDLFDHKAFFNKDESRIEMHLVAKEGMLIESPLVEEGIRISKDESIHTENSYKYSDEDITTFAKRSGLQIMNIFTDVKGWFSLVEFKK